MLKKISLFIGMAISANVVAKGGVSPYLPLNQVPELEHQVQRLLAVSKNTHIMSKPYKAHDIYNVLQTIRHTYPELYQTLSYQLSPYIQSDAGAFAKVTIAAGTKNKTLPNQRGQTTKTNLIVEGGAYANFGRHFGVSVAGIANEDEILPTQSFVYLGYKYAQLDIGYREHWYSPFEDSAMLLSTQAKTTPSITLSNVEPITSFNIRYDMFISQMTEQSGILKEGKQTGVDRVYEPGKPYLFGLHTSFAATDNLTIGLSRLMQFGGGPRSVTLKDFAEGFFSPGSKDNIGREDADKLGENYELGDQLGSITFEYNNSIYSMPYELYGEVALEDTLGGSRNNAYSFGLYLPFIANTHSLRFEHNNWQAGFYGNRIYLDGNRNSGNVIGHWAGDEHNYTDYTPAKSISVNWHWQLSPIETLNTTVRSLENKNSGYKTGYELQTAYTRKLNKPIMGAKSWGAELYQGKDVYGETFARLGVFANF
ncbi:capsule assembly Wzi family protein [Pseudoalteromonas carrageenovora]|uniref:capsule assembly Wzi family protein n=1 Tax=Pseudoalteromonas carrageenovora TaxID=227 RepID=UPI0026E3A5CA|nr:capsule assembly Wzi family protein [Pseudoalteromonas carrageenovora]MDO6635761.1 capsule assembly Wzi family protein [Pseudoalteromonas carrageenovora]MDO6647754.1 capsule assembly Wzi family protein [Pseudoalteromonas carrageenovora]